MTPRQARFVDEFLRDLNATQAAVRAGYSERTANEQAAQLLKRPEIAAAIDAAIDKRSEETQIDAAWVLSRLVEEAEADLADLYDDDGNLLPIESWPLIWRQGLVQGIEVEELFEGKGEEREHIGRVRKIKLDSRIKRVELIGKHVRVNAFQENVRMAGLDGLGDRLQRALERHRNRITDAGQNGPIIDGISERLEPKAMRR